MLFECSLESDPKILMHSVIATDPWKVLTCGTEEGQLPVSYYFEQLLTKTGRPFAPCPK